MPKAQKGQRFGGRQKGSKNKLPRNLVEKIVHISEVLEKEEKGLEDCARENPEWFYENFIRPIIPKNIDVNMDGGLEITWLK